jgi:hypothetical protein
MLEKIYEYNVHLHHLFIDFKQAYNNINSEQLLTGMQVLEIPKKLITMTNITLRNTRCRVKVQNALSEEYEVNIGLRQGDPLSPMLFNLTLERAARAIRTNPGEIIYNRMTQHMAYADDLVITAQTKAALSGATEEFEDAATSLGLRLNEEKTKYMKTTRCPGRKEEKVRLMGRDFPTCGSFKYLGAIVTEANDTNARIEAGNRCMFAVHKILRFRSLTRKVKLLVYKTIIRPVVTYASETWTLTKENERALRVWERIVLRKIYGPMVESGQ